MRRLLPSLLLLVTTGLLGARPAVAHGDEGVLEVVNAVPNATGDAVTYTVELTYANDGDPVEGAVVSATVRGAGGGPQQPIAVPSIGEGWYAATLTFPSPGRWTVTFAAVEPAATVDAVFEVSEAPPSTTTTVAPSTTVAPATVGRLADDGETDGGPPAGLVIGLVAAGAALVATGIVLVLRRQSLDD